MKKIKENELTTVPFTMPTQTQPGLPFCEIKRSVMAVKYQACE